MKTFFTKYHWLFSLILFSLISIFYFGLHVIGHLSTNAVGTSSDVIGAIWLFAWYKHAFLMHSGFFLSKALFYPTGINLTHVNAAPLLSILMLPITLFFGPVVSYNLCAIFAPGLAAWTAYFLCDHVIKSKPYAFISAYFYGFSCYMIAQSLGHLCLVAPAIFIPLLVLVILYKAADKISATKTIMLLTILLTFLFLISLEILATATIWGGVCFLIALYFFKDKKRQLLSLIKPVLISYGLMACLMSPYLYYFLQNDDSVSQFVNLAVYWPAPLLGFFIPNGLFLLHSQSTLHLSSHFTNGDYSEYNVYIGFGFLLLIILYAKQQWQKKETRYLISLIILFSLIAMGPIFHFVQKNVFSFPWAILFKLPILHIALTCRYGLYLSLVLALIIGLWLKKGTWALKYRLLMVGFSGLFLIPVHAPHMKFYTPSFFSTGLYKQDIHQNECLIVLPYAGGPSLLWQAQTNFYFNIAGGYLGVPPNAYANDPVFNALNNTKPTVTRGALARFLHKNKVNKFIIVDVAQYQLLKQSQGYLMEGVDMQDYDKWKTLIAPLSSSSKKMGGVFIYTIKKHVA